MQGFWDDYKKWAAKPFSEDMSAGQWFLLIGFLIVCAVIWNILLRHLLDALKTD